jgi:hypothetical protein
MLYRHIKSGETREFVQGMKIDPLWRPIAAQRIAKGTMSVVEVHPEDVRRIDESTEEDSGSDSALSTGVAAENKLRGKLKKKDSK